ncbi:MAG: 16S rRNA (guanine(966)-N(2))-methyltransferase RsmD [Marinobacter sp.]|uniref:16S rRNA (guanine(966)-N(2))-methyltransferase RsmD n=1 Tax=Marinobacter sp. TaxID=50741 RepID=UPI00299F4E63|nr:16S rRNA (guanine(966)-N(2))-methyltransferase RsmD [Marinobacter sp.]MDX1756905.1 16S rRNA (guanine(966)-N(2))-methyltransferase RsmD [Marinobacter sp.]
MGRKRQPPRKRGNPGVAGELRIIGGDWRSRKLSFPDAGGVRPTPARTRETLFNWLTFHLAGSRCLDLFAGSGALGLEALSRGAAGTTFVEHSPELAQALRRNLKTLQCTLATVSCQDVESFLATPPAQPFDVVFMDPPFRQGWLERLYPLLSEGGWLRPGSWVYVEHESELAPPAPPANWQLHRQKRAGQVCYTLYRVASATD